MGGTIAHAFGEGAAGATAIAASSAFAAGVGYAGQVYSNMIDPCNYSSPGRAAIFAGAGGALAKAFLPTNTLKTIQQANWFQPTSVPGLFASRNSAWWWGATLASGGVAAESLF